MWWRVFGVRFWLGGKLFRLALRTLPDCASKRHLTEHMDGMFWIDPDGRFAKSTVK